MTGNRHLSQWLRWLARDNGDSNEARRSDVKTTGGGAINVTVATSVRDDHGRRLGSGHEVAEASLPTSNEPIAHVSFQDKLACRIR